MSSGRGDRIVGEEVGEGREVEVFDCEGRLRREVLVEVGLCLWEVGGGEWRGGKRGGKGGGRRRGRRGRRRRRRWRERQRGNIRKKGRKGGREIENRGRGERAR